MRNPGGGSGGGAAKITSRIRSPSTELREPARTTRPPFMTSTRAARRSSAAGSREAIKMATPSPANRAMRPRRSRRARAPGPEKNSSTNTHRRPPHEHAESRPCEGMQNGARVPGLNVAIMPERRPKLERTRRREAHEPGMSKINQAFGRDRAGDRHKEEEGRGGGPAGHEHGGERAAAHRSEERRVGK